MGNHGISVRCYPRLGKHSIEKGGGLAHRAASSATIGLLGNLDAVRDAFGFRFILGYEVESGWGRVGGTGRYPGIDVFTTFPTIEGASRTGFDALFVIMRIETFLLLPFLVLAYILSGRSRHFASVDVEADFCTWPIRYHIFGWLTLIMYALWIVFLLLGCGFVST